jgi:alkylation response protein AidB-like acyl-CoA dehydrogenase
MFFGLSDDARSLAAGVHDLLTDACPPDVVRAAWPGGDPSAVDKLWAALGDLGLFGLLVPESTGGLGLDDLVTVAALQQCGYAGVPGPLVETVAVAAPLLSAGDALPAGLLEGSVRVAVQRDARDANGTGPLVPYAAASTHVLQLPGPQPAGSRPRLLPVDDLSVTPVATTDGSRAAARITAAETGTGLALDVGPADVASARHRGVLGTAAYLVGLSRRMLDLTVSYVSNRTQFGVAIGSFQAVQHPLADALVAVEFAEPVVLRAAQSLVDDDPATGIHVAMAKALASDAATQATRGTLQAHGAMGYTVEYDLHLFAKRAWALAADWGSAAEHRATITRTLLPEETP